MIPLISVVVCTFNRSAYLQKAIASLVSQTLVPSHYEIIIVDNGSQDETKQVVESIKNVSNIIYQYEREPGLSRSRNTGCQIARGKYVAYLDDDAEADSHWLEEILKIFQANERIGCLTGKVEPIWGAPRPSWLTKEFEGKLSLLDLGSQTRQIIQKEWIVGVNMAFPRKLLEASGGFLDQVGRKRDQLLSAEEIVMREAIEKLGYETWYHPKAVVCHHIPLERMNEKWFLKRAFWQGASDGILEGERKSPILRIITGLRTFAAMIFCFQELKIMLGLGKKEPLKARCSVQARLGHILKLWGIV